MKATRIPLLMVGALAFGVIFVTPAPAQKLDVAIADDGPSFCAAAYELQRAEADPPGFSDNAPVELLPRVQPVSVQSATTERYVCDADGPTPRVEFDAFCSRADSWNCVKLAKD